MARKISHEEFDKRVQRKYSGNIILLDEYKGMNKSISFKCLTCGKRSSIKQSQSLLDKNSKSGCKQCSIEKFTKLQKNNALQKNADAKEEFLRKLKDMHNDRYAPLDEYVKCDEKIRFECCEHGRFQMTPESILSGQGCPKCARERIAESARTRGRQRSNQYRNTYLARLKDIHNGEIQMLSNYKAFKKDVTVKCSNCGYVWSVRADSLVSNQRPSGCPKCKNTSKQINSIFKLLDKNNIKFMIENTFRDCKDKYVLRFDIKINELLIEYDGKQHFENVEYFGGEGGFQERINRDKIKNQYCIENDIPLIRVPYWELENIEYILENVLKYFNIIDGQPSDIKIVEKYYVRDGWDQESYISQAPFNKKELVAQ